MRKEIVVLTALCAALNLGLGTAVYMLKLPIYLDMVGTLLCGLILWQSRGVAFAAGATAGVISFFLGGIVNPYLPWFSFTVIAVAAFTALATSRHSQRLRTAPLASPGFWARLVSFGVLTGLVAALLSAPVVVFLFGGVTGSGTAVLVAFFLKTGSQLIQAALLSGMAAEPVDKCLQLLIAVLLLRATPVSFLARFQGDGMEARG
jgi:energy-coupling factor transport system substrate-specific component